MSCHLLHWRRIKTGLYPKCQICALNCIQLPEKEMTVGQKLLLYLRLCSNEWTSYVGRFMQ